MTNKKIKIHVKNNHWAPGSFPTDAEGEKNFTITKEHLDEALNNFPEIKEKVEIVVDWDENNFKTSMANSDILVAWNFSTTNLKKIAPNLKWIHVISAGVEHLHPLDWMFDGLVLTNSSGAHAKKSASGKTVSILSIVITFEHPSAILPLLFTPIIFAPSGATSFAIDTPRVPVPTTTTVFPAIGLLNSETKLLFFWLVIMK